MPPATQEPGPDFSSFEGGAGAAGGIIGTNQLQTAIDKFTQAVDKLDTVASKMGGQAAGSTIGAGGAGGGFPRPVNPFISSMGPGPSVPYPKPGNVGPGQVSGASERWPQETPTPFQPGPAPTMPNAGAPVFNGAPSEAAANAGGAVITPTRPGQGNATPQQGGGGKGSGRQGGGGGSGGGFTAAGMAGAAGAGMGAGGGMLGSLAKGALSFAPAPIAAAITGLASAGAAEQPSQLALNTLQFQSSLYGQDYGTTRTGAMGTSGTVMGGQQQVEWGMNPSDMAASYASLQQTTTNLNPYAKAFGGRNVMAGMGAMNIANPAMSGAQNAGAVGQLYDPATSLRMMQMGYPTTPRQAGTGAARPMADVMAPFLNRLGGGKPLSQAQLFAQMQPGQKGYVGLQNLTGADPTQMGQYSTTLGIQNALMTGQKGQKAMTLSQVDQTFAQLSSSNVPTFNAGKATLSKYGVKQSDIQAMKSQAGGQAANVSDTSQGFSNGLQAATRSLSDFNSALHKVVNSIPGGRGILGSVEGFAANILGGGAAGPPSRAGDTGNTSHKAAAQASSINAKAGQAVQIAKTQLGVPYGYGQESPGHGFDCSALPQWAYKAAGVTLPRTAADQLRFLSGSLVSPSAVQEGDLVFQPGVGPTAHEAMLVDNGKSIIEARGVGTQISTRKYNPGEWPKAARPWNLGKGGPSKNKPAKGASKTNVVGGGAGSGSGQQVANYAETFATGLSHPYVWGGSSPNGWDCSGFAAVIYEHFGYFPGKGVRFGNTTSQFADTKYLQPSGPQVGALVYEAGSDGTVSAPGHMGIMTGPGKMVAASSPAVGTINQTISGLSGYRIPKGGFNGKGGAAPAGAPAAAAAAASGSSGGGGLGGLSAGTGDYATEGSTSELSAFSSAILGGGLGGAPSAPKPAAAAGAPAAGGSAPAGNGVTGIAALAKYLKSAGYSKPAAAGAAGVAGGEGTGANPEVVGSGGAGLIGWTPPSAMIADGGTCKAAGIGNNSVAVDMANQEKAMVMWMKQNGWPPPQASFANSLAGAMQAAFSASAAYERPAVRGSDVHAANISAAWSSLATGGKLPAGKTSWVGERGPELISVSRDSTVHNAADSARLAQSMAGSAHGPYSSGPQGGYKYSQAHHLFSGGSGGSGHGISISFAAGSIVVGAPGSTTAAGMSVTGNSGAVMAQSFAKQLKAELGKLNLAGAIGSGVSS